MSKLPLFYSQEITPDLVNAFDDLVIDTRPDTDCHPWRGYVNFSGFPQFRWHGRYYSAQRASWYLTHRDGDLASMRLTLTCGNKLCVNVDHMVKEPTVACLQRAGKRGSFKTGEGNFNAKMTDQSVRLIREMVSKGIRLATIADAFNVSVATISLIANRKRWAHVQDGGAV
jgi:hypothetical protein